MKRIVSNYLRLASTFIFGLLIVRIMTEIGPDAALIYLLLVSSTGIAAMFKVALQNALIPVLGLSIDGKGEHGFSEMLWTSFAASALAGLFSIALFAIFWAVSGSLNFGALSASTIGVALLTTGIHAFISSIAIVFLNLILIDNRVVTYNILLILERAGGFVAAVIALMLPASYDMDTRVQVFYVLFALFVVLVQGLIYILAVRGKPEFRLRRAPMQFSGQAWVGKLLGWNAAVVIAFALFTRWPPLVVNWSMDEGMTLIIGIVLTLIGYQRQLSMGLVVGLDAMVSRYFGGGGDDGEAQARALTLRFTYILSVFSAFSVALISLFVEPLLDLWIGDTLSETSWSAEACARLFRIMAFGIAVSIVSEGWMRYLSGKGEVGAFAPKLLIAGCIHILCVIAAVQFYDGLAALEVIAWSFSVVFLIVNLWFIAGETAKRLGVGRSTICAVMAVPAILAVIAAFPGLYYLAQGWTSLGTGISLGTLAFAGVVALMLTPLVVAKALASR